MTELENLQILKSMIEKRIAELTKTDTKSDKEYIRQMFKQNYEAKIKEITGDAGKLPWTGKEAKLLQSDIKTHGKEALEKYIFIFFSDEDKSVSDFTRDVMKAGYGYSVFHGLIPKLALSKIKPKKACKYCGKTSGHAHDCPVSIAIRKERGILRKEVEEYREANNINLTEMLFNNIRGKNERHERIRN